MPLPTFFIFMSLKDRNKRSLIVHLQPETIMDLLNQLPKRLLMEICKEYKLTPLSDTKAAYILCIAEHRRVVFQTLTFKFTYEHPNQSA